MPVGEWHGGVSECACACVLWVNVSKSLCAQSRLCSPVSHLWWDLPPPAPPAPLASCIFKPFNPPASIRPPGSVQTTPLQSVNHYPYLEPALASIVHRNPPIADFKTKNTGRQSTNAFTLLRKLKRSSTRLPTHSHTPQRNAAANIESRIADTIIHHREHQLAQAYSPTMMLMLTGLILAVLSIPFIVYAGERTIQRTLPKPRFVRNLSETVSGRLAPTKRRSSDPGATTTRDDDDVQMASQSGSQREGERPGIRRTDTGPSDPDLARVSTGFSVSSGETYVRGMTLEKIGLD